MIPKAVHVADDYIQDEFRYGAHNYHPLPVVLKKGKGIYVWDVEGEKYIDFLSAYSAVNQGHSNAKIVKALADQANQLSLTSRSFHNDKFSQFAKMATSYFGFDMMLPMNTGAEAVETAIKLARKWGVQKKGIAENKAEILVCLNNFHGRTTTIVSFSSDPVSQKDFGPFTPGFISIAYNDPDALEKVFNERPNIVGFLVEPIQGEAGVNTPSDDYMQKVQALCNAHNVLFMADEIQTGIGRTGSLLAVCGNCSCQSACEQQQETYARPDILILGKALGGGVYPVSAVLADREVMEVIRPGEHGSTFGGNPVASAVGMASLQVIEDERLAQNARALGQIFRAHLNEYKSESKVLVGVRGRGLLNAIVINDSQEGSLAWDICMTFKEKGLLAKPTHGNIIRFAPPLVITNDELLTCIKIIIDTLREFEPS